MALRLGDMLLEKGLIKAQDLEEAINEQHETKEILGKILIKRGLITEKQLLEVLAEQQGVEFVELRELEVDKKIVEEVPAKFAWHYKIMPINIADNVLTVAISDPFDMWAMDDLETNLGYRVEKALATSADIMEAIKKYYGVAADTIESILSEKPKEDARAEIAAKDKVEDLEKMAEDSSVIKLVNQILQQAINDRATDIHIESFRNELLLRYRVDGILYDTQVSENIKYLYPAIISRIKVMSGLDIIERRLPQDGRAKVKIGKTEYDLRVSIIPTLYRENIVIRILPTSMLYDITDLGMSKEDSQILEGLLKKPHGIIFVTGPTGSGKSTTLYASLTKLNTRTRKIVTIEDPIEYELRGVSQTQVNPKINLTFAKMLRSMLRHDPDVIMVGEVRDFETAEITIQTALTGHLVFSTLHTNDAAGGITRLVDMGIDPFLITSSVEAFIAQRLVRTICTKCKEKYKLEEGTEELNRIAQELKVKTVYKGKGCKECNGNGYSGRIGIYEILVINDQIRKMILEKASSDAINDKAIELGMRTLQQDGWAKVAEGITTVEEVMRVTQLEE